MSHHPVDIHVGKRIKMRRNQLGISQMKMAESIGVTFQQIQKYERASNRIAASRLLDLARVLECEVNWFFEGLESDGSPSGDQLALDQLYDLKETRILMRALTRLPESKQRVVMESIRGLCELL